MVDGQKIWSTFLTWYDRTKPFNWTYWDDKLCFHWCSSKKAIKIKRLLQFVSSSFQVYIEWTRSFMEAMCWLMSHSFNWIWRCEEYAAQYPHHSCPLLIEGSILSLNKVFYPNFPARVRGGFFYPWIAFQIVNEFFIAKSLGVQKVGTFWNIYNI